MSEIDNSSSPRRNEKWEHLTERQVDLIYCLRYSCFMQIGIANKKIPYPLHEYFMEIQEKFNWVITLLAVGKEIE